VNTATYSVSGMTCGHCADAVTEELSLLEGVDSVEVALVANGISTVTVTSDAPLPLERVSAALDEAGDYLLV
jgi:copper chaperone